MPDEALTYLASLPKPSLIAEIDYEVLLAERKAQLVARFDAKSVPYDVQDLETDSAIIQIEEATFEETLLRALGNDIARGRYRAFAKGADLDHLAEFYEVRRMAGELDDRLNHRITLAQQGRSTTGPEPWYAAKAMEASIRVADVHVYQDPLLPIVEVAVLAADNGGLADAELLAIVEAAVAGRAVRPMTARVRVRSAVRRLTDVVADCTLLPETTADVLEKREASLPATWAAVGMLGRDLTEDWLKAALMGGMYSVAIRSGPLAAAEHEMVRIGAVTLNPIGRAR